MRYSVKTWRMRNHDVRLLTRWDGKYGAEAMIAKPNFYTRSVFSKNLVAIEMCKLEVKFDKSIYEDMYILDIRRVCMNFIISTCYRSFVKNIKSCIPIRIALYTTSSATYKISWNAISLSSIRAIIQSTRILLVNIKMLGLMKDENNGVIMTAFVGLRVKMYALRVDGKKDTKKVKGVKSNIVARTITFNDYTWCLQDEIEMTRTQPCIRSKLHKYVHDIGNENCTKSVWW